MSRLNRLSFLALLAVLVVSPARAQVAGHPVELSVGGGWTMYDARDYVKDAVGFGGSLGYRWSTGLTFEGSYLNSPTHRELPFGEGKHSFSWYGLDLRWSLRDPSEKVTPYLLTGLGVGRSHDPGLALSRKGAPTLGAGVIMSLGGRERMHVRFQVRDLMLREAGADGFSNHVETSVALQWTFRGKSKDADLDGVRNWLDECANTPIGAKVDAKGCPIDSDGDGLPDGEEVERGTSPTAGDSDADGLADGAEVRFLATDPLRADTDADGLPDGDRKSTRLNSSHRT